MNESKMDFSKPATIENIAANLNCSIKKATRIAELRDRVKSGTASYDDCVQLAKLIGTSPKQWYATVAHFDAVNTNRKNGL